MNLLVGGAGCAHDWDGQRKPRPTRFAKTLVTDPAEPAVMNPTKFIFIGLTLLVVVVVGEQECGTGYVLCPLRSVSDQSLFFFPRSLYLDRSTLLDCHGFFCSDFAFRVDPDVSSDRYAGGSSS
jgi:hypothetical protein